MAGDALSFEANVLKEVESRPEGASEKDLSAALGAEGLPEALATLAESGAVEKRAVGGITMWYPLLKDAVRKVLIVEDDENINNLIKIAVGKGCEIAQSFDGDDALAKVRDWKPDLVLLDLMIPGPNGIEVCGRIKRDPATKGMTVIIVSAADERRNMFVSLKEGADYYVKKPFDTGALRALVNIFLRKKGKRFDPLVDLPDTERISREVEHLTGEGDFEVNNLRISGLRDYVRAYGEAEAEAVARLVSQILQDKAREWRAAKGFVGYIGNGEFVVCGSKNEASVVIGGAVAEFDRVLPFIRQSHGIAKAAQWRPEAKLSLEDIFDSSEKMADGLSLRVEQIPPERIVRKREEIIGRGGRSEAGDYTLGQIQELFGSSEIDLSITRTPGGVKLGLSKGEGQQ
ncbi:MAG: response regulator [Candidatus ainarchaeum sp.]|nr:response regulator [Candidatus ainarchaeum sp.]